MTNIVIERTNPPWSAGLFGAPGSGKSYLAKAISRAHINAFVFDPLDEYEGLGVGGVPSDEKLVSELEYALADDAIDCIIFDEVYRYTQRPDFLEIVEKELMTFKHNNKTWLVIAQRPHLIPKQVRGLFDYYFLFNLFWADDRAVIDGMRKGLGEKLTHLNPEEFLIVSSSNFEPVNEAETYKVEVDENQLGGN